MVGGLLQAGVVIAAAVGCVGAVLSLLRSGGAVAGFHQFLGGSDPLRQLDAVFRGVSQGDPRAIMQLGVLLLIATPIARVVLSLAVFVHQRDRTYIAVTLLVLGILAWGLLGSQV